MSHDDFDFEPMPGLPAYPPKGERVLWQGGPDWRLMARDVLHVRAVAAYFAVVIVWRSIASFMDGSPGSAIAGMALWLAAIAMATLAVLGIIAWAMSRTTVYTITSRRVVMRIGVALPITFNLPFTAISSAATARRRDGSGDVALELMNEGQRLGYAVLWPHARPWRLARPQPSLRCLPVVQPVASILAKALAEHAADQAHYPAQTRIDTQHASAASDLLPAPVVARLQPAE